MTIWLEQMHSVKTSKPVVLTPGTTGKDVRTSAWRLVLSVGAVACFPKRSGPVVNRLNLSGVPFSTRKIYANPFVEAQTRSWKDWNRRIRCNLCPKAWDWSHSHFLYVALSMLLLLRYGLAHWKLGSRKINSSEHCRKHGWLFSWLNNFPGIFFGWGWRSLDGGNHMLRLC